MRQIPASVLEANAKVYVSLQGTRNTIRLLHGSRNRWTRRVSWELSHYDLDSQPSRRYTALSYAWGNGKPDQCIQLNGQAFRVLDSVYAILDAIVYNSEFSLEKSWSDSWWWIDSVCINQKDSDERMAQVKLMGDIYAQSCRAIGWLGKGSAEEGREEDGGFIERGEIAIGSLLELPRHRNAIVRRPDSSKAIETVSALVDWRALEELLQRPWWTRVWTLQEFLLPKVFELWCGKRHISKHKLKDAIYCLWAIRREAAFKGILNEEIWLPAWNRRRLFMWQQETPNRLPLVALVAYGSDCEATYAEDRIYSVLGLAQRNRDKSLVQVNYNNRPTPGEVYTNFVVDFIRKHHSLDIICFVHIFSQKSGGRRIDEDLPSWVPDWTTKIQSFVIPVMASQSSNSLIGNFRPIDELHKYRNEKAYAASGTRGPQCIIKHHKILECRGIPLDTLQGIDDTHGSLNARKDLHPQEASFIIDEISRVLVMGREDRYLTAEIPLGYFYHGFRKLCLDSVTHRKVPQLFSNWFNANRDLMIGGYSLEEVCNLSLPLPRFTESYQAKKLHKHFFERFRDTIESMDRVLMVTQNDRLVLAPRQALTGDKICVLLGCSIPLVLRRKTSIGGEGMENFELIGECYLDAFMDGEAVEMLKTKKLEEELFRIV